MIGDMENVIFFYYSLIANADNHLFYEYFQLFVEIFNFPFISMNFYHCLRTYMIAHNFTRNTNDNNHNNVTIVCDIR